MRDAGEYQCQVNTEPKISYSFYLTVEGKIYIIQYDVITLHVISYFKRRFSIVKVGLSGL